MISFAMFKGVLPLYFVCSVSFALLLCNARDQASDVVLRKSPCVKYFHHHIIDNHVGLTTLAATLS